MTSGTGASVVYRVEAASRGAHETAPIPLRLMAEHNVQDPTKKLKSVIMVHAQVGEMWMTRYP